MTWRVGLTVGLGCGLLLLLVFLPRAASVFGVGICKKVSGENEKVKV